MAITAITVPKWGIEMQEGTLTEWKVAVGDRVSKGDEILDMETEKIVNAAEAPASGVVRRILGEPGDVFEVGVLLGVIADADESDDAVDRFIAEFKPVDASFEGGGADVASPAESSKVATPAPTRDEAAASAAGEPPRISPIARRLAEAEGLDWTTLTGTGRNGRISKDDVEQALAAQQGDVPIPRSVLQKTVAARMAAAKQAVPHFYLEVQVICDRAQQLRADYNRRHGTKVTLNDVIVKAVGVALHASPAVNVRLDGDALYAADGGVGVAIAAEEGLVAPVVDGVAAASLRRVSEQTKRLVEAAGARTLEAGDLKGGATTVSNLGMFGVDRFTAIINPPQTSILAVGRAAPQAVVRDGKLEAATVMTITMSCDHRAFDGAAGAQFLALLRERLEQPAKLFDD